MCIILVILIFRRFVVLRDFSTSSLPWRLRGNLVVLFNVWVHVESWQVQFFRQFGSFFVGCRVILGKFVSGLFTYLLMWSFAWKDSLAWCFLCSALPWQAVSFCLGHGILCKNCPIFTYFLPLRGQDFLGSVSLRDQDVNWFADIA